MFKPDRILVVQAAQNSEIASRVLEANPGVPVQYLKYNTDSWNGKFVSLKDEDHFKVKRKNVAVLHRTALWKPDPNGRSTDFLPSIKLGTGCGFFCQYCYTERRMPNNYPKLYDDCFKMVEMVSSTVDNLSHWQERFRQVCRREFEKDRDPKHPPYITFDLGCDTDCTIDNQITKSETYVGHIVDIMNKIAQVPGAMTSFATKGDDVDQFIVGCKFPEKHRIRLSLMPENHRRILEMNTATIERRLLAANKLVAAGFEVHLNLSPVVVTLSFCKEYRALFRQIDDTLTKEAKDQLAYEIIFLTHSADLFQAIEARRPEAHSMMAQGPLELVPKWNKPNVLSYSRKDKSLLKPWLLKAISQMTPYSRVRYIF